MATEILNLINTYVEGQPPSSADLNRRANTFEHYSVRLCELLGAGVAPVPDETALQVSADGTGVTIAAGRAIVETSQMGCAPVVSEQSESLSEGLQNDSEDNYIFAVAVQGSVASDPDARISGAVEFAVSDSNELEDGLLLARATMAGGIVTDVEDLRSWIRFDQAILDLAAALARIGTLEETLEALMGGEDGDGPAILWATLQRALGDERTIEAVIDEKIAAAVSGLEELIATGGRRPMQTKDDVMAHELAIVRQEIIKLKFAAGLRSQSANILKTDNDGIYGTGLNGSPQHLGATTLTLDEDTGAFEP